MALRPTWVLILLPHFLLLATLARCTSAQSRNVSDWRVKNGFLFCGCSPSARGASSAVSRMLVLGLVRARAANRRAFGQSASARFAIATRTLGDVMADCAGTHGLEACVNADAGQMRVYCSRDAESGAVLAREGDVLRAAMACDKRSATRSPLRAVAAPTGTPAAVTETPEPGPTAEGGVSEGCVAVEHIRGYVLQHRRHLRRDVLCGRGFCATPNHMIIVRGGITSMGRLCADEGGWRCVRTVKLVNNLKLAVNRRAVVNEFIAVTPYDVRFPKAAIWIVQMLEDSLALLTGSLLLGGVAAFCVVVQAGIQLLGMRSASFRKRVIGFEMEDWSSFLGFGFRWFG